MKSSKKGKKRGKSKKSKSRKKTMAQADLAQSAHRLSIIAELKEDVAQARTGSGRRMSVSMANAGQAVGATRSELDPNKHYNDDHADEDLSAQALRNIRQRRASVDQGVGPAMAGLGQRRASVDQGVGPAMVPPPSAVTVFRQDDEDEDSDEGDVLFV